MQPRKTRVTRLDAVCPTLAAIICALLCILACATSNAASGAAALEPAAATPTATASPGYLSALQHGQEADVIVAFDTTVADREAASSRSARHLLVDDAQVLAQREARYRQSQAQIERAVAGADAVVKRRYTHLPMAVWHLKSLAALARLRAQPSVVAISSVRRVHTVCTSSCDLALTDQPQAYAAGATGAGTTVLVIDAGVDLTNSAFGTCPQAGASGCNVVYDEILYPGSGYDIQHGTNVSGVVLEMAPGAGVAMYNVFDGSSASTTDILTAMDWGINNQATYNIVAMNLSLGDGNEYTSACTTIQSEYNVFITAATQAANAGIQAVAASGNNGFTGGINFPACTPGFVSVGAVYDGNTSVGGNVNWGVCTDATSNADQVVCFANMASYMSLLAPGVDVTAAGIELSGTSQATPHVSGAIAALRARYPKEPLSQATTRLTLTGTTDSRGSIAVPRINLLAAYDAGAQLVLTGSGPAIATPGTTSTYTLKVTNNGPLIATDVNVSDALPSLGTFVAGSSSSACSASGSTVNCLVSSLAVGSSTSFTIGVRWGGSGAAYAVYDTAAASADQIDPVPAEADVQIGTAPATDVPIPAWALGLAALILMEMLRRERTANGQRRRSTPFAT